MSRFWNRVRILLKLDRKDDNSYMQVILYIISGTSFIITGILAATNLFLGFKRITGPVTGAWIISGIMLLLTWRGALRWPRFMFPLLTLFISTYIIIGGGGIRDQAVYAYPLIIMLAGLLLGPTGVIAYTLLGLLTLATIGYGEINGWIVTPFSADTRYFNIIALCAMLVFIGVVLYVTIKNLINSLHRARQNEKELALSNHELQTIRASLETQVAERTQSAEDARRAAEQANRALEIQMR